MGYEDIHIFLFKVVLLSHCGCCTLNVNCTASADKLGRALDHQLKYQEAEETFRQAVQGRDKVIGKEHEHTLRSRRALQELQIPLSPPIVVSTTMTVVPDHLSKPQPGSI